MNLVFSLRLRRRAARSAGVAALLACALGVIALPAFAAPKLHLCKNVDRTVVVGEVRVACSQARSVASSFLAGKRHIQGFSCRRIAVNAAAGFIGNCTHRAQLIRIIPE